MSVPSVPENRSGVPQELTEVTPELPDRGLTSAERSAFEAEHARLAATATGEPEPRTCEVCGHWWLGWPASTCPRKGRHGAPPADRISDADIERFLCGFYVARPRLHAALLELEERRAGDRGTGVVPAAATPDVTALTAALRALITRIRRVGGYSTPAEQQALWEAEQLVGGQP